MSYLENVISGEQRGVIPAMLRVILLLISWISSGVVRSRRWLYSRGVLRDKHLSCAAISVGNIVVGGSGKTPTVVYIARMLKNSANLSVAVLSRGYRSKARVPAVVSDGENVLLGPSDAGDEPHMLARSLPGIPVLIGKDRFQTGSMAVRKWACQAVILDDGFQYLRLARDVDIIVMDATRPFGFDHILPRGYLREPISALRHADLLLLTRVDQCEDLDSIRDRLDRIAPSVPVFEGLYEPRFLLSLDTHQEMELDAIRDKRILALCGIANPLSFAKTLRSLDPAEVILMSFPDHHAYPPRSIESIREKAAESGADLIVTTEKDAPKLGAISDKTVLSLIVELRLVGSTAETFLETIRRKCGYFYNE